MKTLIAVISYQGDAENGNHDAIRKTWGADVDPATQDLRFFIGRRGPEFQPKPDEVLTDWLEHRQCSHDWWVDVKGCCVDFWQVETKGILYWSLTHGYDFTFMIENDTFVVLERFIMSGYWLYDFCGTFEPADYVKLGEKTAYEVYGEHIYPSPEPGIGYTVSRKAAKIILDTPYDWHTIGVYAGQCLGPHIASENITARSMTLGSYHYRLEAGAGYPPGSNWQREMYDKHKEPR